MQFFTNIFTICCFILFTFQTKSQWQGPYRIRGIGSNRCLDISGGHRRNGARLIIWDCHRGANQKWYINQKTREFRVGAKNGKCLDIHGGHYNQRRNGATLHAWSCHRGQNQKFRFVGKHIRSQGKMNGRCLDVWRAQRRRGAKVILWPCHRGSNQQWKLEWSGRQLRCPRGTRTIGKQGQRNDIGGCGIGGCNSRYSARTINQCSDRCRRHRRCRSFSWAPLGGDRNHRSRNVCTLYDKTRANNKWGPNQVMCSKPRKRKKTPSRCIYQHRGRIKPRKGKRLRNINIKDDMIISMEIKMKGWPRTTYGNIIHIGKRNTIRQPAIWINKGKFLHIVYGTKRNWNRLKNLHRVRLGKKYKIEYRIRSNGYNVYINGRRWFTVRNRRHHNYGNQPLYLGDPWHEAANAEVSNLKIMTGTNPRVCKPRRRRRRKRRKRRRRKRPRKRRRVKRRKRDKSGWHCFSLKYRDYVRKRCIRKRKGKMRFTRSKKFRKQKHGYKEGYRMGRKAALRSARMKRMTRSGLSGMSGMGGMSGMRRMRLRKFRGRVPRPPKIRLVFLKGRGK